MNYKFSELSSTEKYRRFKAFDDVLNKNSNGDNFGFLYEYFKCSKNTNLLLQLSTRLLNNDSLMMVLNNINTSICAVPQNLKKHYLSLISNVFSYKDLQRLQFQITDDLYYSSIDFQKSLFNNLKQHYSINNKIATTNLRTKDKIKFILRFLLEHSKTSSDIINKGFNKKISIEIYNELGISYCSIYYYQLSKTNLWKMFNSTYPVYQMCFNSFLNYFPHNFKRAATKTDMCDICIIGDDLLTQRFTLSTQNQAIFDQNPEFQAYKLHIKFNKLQSESFNFLIKNMGNNSAILLADYKENFQIGGSPVENSQIHYFKVPIALLSFGMYFKVDNIIKFKIFNFFSYILDKDSQFIQHCLTILLFNPFIINNINSIEMWTDCAGHFRSKYMLNYYKSWNAFSKGVKFTYVNFFNEKHGKSVLDGYFGVLSRWQSDYEKSGKISSINHLVDIFSAKHNQSNPKSLYYNYENVIIYYQSIVRHLYYKNIDDIRTFLSYKLDDSNPNIILRSPYRNFNSNSYISIYSDTHFKINPKFKDNSSKPKTATHLLCYSKPKIGINTNKMIFKRAHYAKMSNLFY